MATPFVFITTHNVRPGSLDALKALTRDYTAFLDEHDARLVAHSAFLNEDETELSLGAVQHTVAAGRELRLVVAFGHEDVVVAMSGGRPSALVLTTR